MTLRPCLVCGALTSGSYCSGHYRRRNTPGRTTKAQAKFRAAVLADAGHRCQWTEDGRRCTATRDLHAHHMSLLRDTGSFDPADGVCLCPRHHVEADRRLHGKYPARWQFGFPCDDAA